MCFAPRPTVRPHGAPTRPKLAVALVVPPADPFPAAVALSLPDKPPKAHRRGGPSAPGRGSCPILPQVVDLAEPFGMRQIVATLDGAPSFQGHHAASHVTSMTPAPSGAMAANAARLRSSCLPVHRAGPLSVTRTSTHGAPAGRHTRRRVSKGRVLDAAVNPSGSKCSPLAVVAPRAYQLARPWLTAPPAGSSSGGGAVDADAGGLPTADVGVRTLVVDTAGGTGTVDGGAGGAWVVLDGCGVGGASVVLAGGPGGASVVDAQPATRTATRARERAIYLTPEPSIGAACRGHGIRVSRSYSHPRQVSASVVHS